MNTLQTNIAVRNALYENFCPNFKGSLLVGAKTYTETLLSTASVNDITACNISV